MPSPRATPEPTPLTAAGASSTPRRPGPRPGPGDAEATAGESPRHRWPAAGKCPLHRAGGVERPRVCADHPAGRVPSGAAVHRRNGEPDLGSAHPLPRDGRSARAGTVPGAGSDRRPPRRDAGGGVPAKTGDHEDRRGTAVGVGGVLRRAAQAAARVPRPTQRRPAGNWRIAAAAEAREQARSAVVRPGPTTGLGGADTPATPVLTRFYRVLIQGLPALLICESFSIEMHAGLYRMTGCGDTI